MVGSVGELERYLAVGVRGGGMGECSGGWGSGEWLNG